MGLASGLPESRHVVSQSHNTGYGCSATVLSDPTSCVCHNVIVKARVRKSNDNESGGF